MHHMKLGNFDINFNGDFSGDIIVQLTDGAGFVGTREVARIPFMVMAAVVGEKLRREKMAELEKLGDLEPLEAFSKLVYGDEESNGKS